MAPLSKEENNIIKFEPRLIAKWDRFHDLCTALVSTYYEETLRIATIEHRAWRAGLEDLRIEEEVSERISHHRTLPSVALGCIPLTLT